MTEALRRHLDRYRSRYQPDPERMHVLHRLLACRTAKLGMHSCVCTACGFSELAYNSCRDRHCPQCQGRASAQWLADRQEKMLPVGHFQVVFTLPAELRPLAFDNPALVYGLLFQVGASILQDLATQRLEVRLGLTGVLHTWTSELNYHPHVHFLVTAGGLHHDDESWVSTGETYLFPGRILGAMFRGRFLEALIAAFDRGELVLRGETVAARKSFRSIVRALSKRHARWVVHVEAPEGRPVSHVTKYLVRYIKRVAISGARIVSVSETSVSFSSRRGLVTLDGDEFVRRFLLHVLPKGFRKIRHYGLYAPGNAQSRLECARELVASLSPGSGSEASADSDTVEEVTSSSRVPNCSSCGSPDLIRVFFGSLPPPRGPP